MFPVLVRSPADRETALEGMVKQEFERRQKKPDPEVESDGSSASSEARAESLPESPDMSEGRYSLVHE